MPDDRYNGPRTDDQWSSSDSPGTDDWSSTPPPTNGDSWASDLWATTSEPGSDIWSPPGNNGGADSPASAPWASDLWGSSGGASTDTWMSGVDTPATDGAAGSSWVGEAWESTEPSPWVSDLWASTEPAPSETGWSVDEATAFYADPPPAADETSAVDQVSAADPSVSVSEPFWRSESWLLEPLAEETQAVDLTGAVDGEAIDWPDAAEAESPASPGWDAGDASDDGGTDVATDPAADNVASDLDPLDNTQAVNWGDLGDDSETRWSTYQRELDAPAEGPTRPSARTPDSLSAPTNASDFASQRSAMAPAPPTKGFPGLMYKMSAGHVQMKPTKDEQIRRDSTADIRRGIAGLRQITFTNPKGGSGKTTAALLTSMTLGQLRGGYVLAWDNNETQGTLGVRARREDHANTVRDLIADLPAFSGPVAGRVGDLAKYIRSQGDAMFDILASDEQAEAGEMMTAAAFQAVREVVGRFYKIICVDTGNNVRAANWAASIDSTDQLVVTASVRWESAYSASRMLDYLEQSGRGDLVSNAVTVLTMPASMKGLNLAQVQDHFGVRTREVLCTPFDEQLDNGDEIPFDKLDPATRRAWLQIGAAITRGL